MKLKRWWTNIVFLLLLTFPFVQASPLDTLRNVGNRIIMMGNLQFLGLNNIVILTSLMRIMLWILVFTILFALTSNEHIVHFFNRKYAAIVSGIIATMAAFFLMDSLLLLIGSGAATIVAFVLIGGPVVGVGYLLWRIPGGEHGHANEEHAGHVFLKLCLCVFLLWILGAIKYHLIELGA